LNYNTYWQWRSSAIFEYNVAGVALDTIELIAYHGVDYQGNYVYSFATID
jgi:hypothetical protein